MTDKKNTWCNFYTLKRFKNLVCSWILRIFCISLTLYSLANFLYFNFWNFATSLHFLFHHRQKIDLKPNSASWLKPQSFEVVIECFFKLNHQLFMTVQWITSSISYSPDAIICCCICNAKIIDPLNFWTNQSKFYGWKKLCI